MLATKLLLTTSASGPAAWPSDMSGTAVVQELGSYETGLSEGAFTLTGVMLGTPSANRVVALAFAALNGNLPTSVKVGGVSATQAVRSPETSLVVASIWYAALPSGATGDIVVVKPVDSCAMAWFSFETATPTPLDTATGSGTGGVSLVLDTGNRGLVLWAQCDRSNAASHTATINGVQRSASEELRVNSTRSGSAGLLSGTGEGVGNLVTLSAGSDTTRAVAASWSV